MKRYEVIQLIMRWIHNEVVVCNLGHPSQELFQIKDRPRNFYMLGSMGLASSIGLGLALSIRQKVIVIDGDGSLLMNLGSLATIGVNQPDNLVLIILDNQAYGSTGFQPSFTAKNIDLSQIAQACNIKQTFRVSEADEINHLINQATTSSKGPYCVIIDIEKGLSGPVVPIPYDSITIRNRFMESIQYD